MTLSTEPFHRRRGAVTARKRILATLIAMLLRRMLIRLPDRPGSLGQVTTLLGRLGVDIRQVRVLSRDGGAAIDDFVVAVSGPVIERSLAALLGEVPGVEVTSMWPVEEHENDWWPSVPKESAVPG